MTHEEAVERLHDLELGRLDDGERFELDTHLAECEECRSTAAFGIMLREGVEEMGTEWLPTSRAAHWKEHGAGYLIAASILIALLAYPAYLGVVRLPEAAATIADLRREKSLLEEAVTEEKLVNHSGAVALHLIRSPLREEGHSAEIFLDPADLFVLLGVELVIPPEIEDEAMLHFRIGEEGKESATVVEIAVEEARQQVQSAGVVTLIVDSTSLPSGGYELHVLVEGRLSLLETRFEVK